MTHPFYKEKTIGVSLLEFRELGHFHRPVRDWALLEHKIVSSVIHAKKGGRDDAKDTNGVIRDVDFFFLKQRALVVLKRVLLMEGIL
jgi:hypothetical protein